MESDYGANGHALANGQAKLNGTIEKVEKTIYKQENIFVFIPNIIGKEPSLHIGKSDSYN